MHKLGAIVCQLCMRCLVVYQSFSILPSHVWPAPTTHRLIAYELQTILSKQLLCNMYTCTQAQAKNPAYDELEVTAEYI